MAARRPRRALVAGVAAVVVVALAGGLVAAGLRDGDSPAPGPPDTTGAGGRPAGEARGGPSVLLVWTADALDPGVVSAATADPAVTAMSVVRGDPVDLVRSRTAEGTPVDEPAAGWSIPLDALAIDPAGHAELVPPADQRAVAALGDGEALLGETSARLRGLGPGGVIELAGGQSVTVAAVVSDDAVAGAELVVDRATGERLGVLTDRYAVLAYEGDRSELEQRLQSELTTASAVRFRGPSETRFLRSGDAVLPQSRIKERFGEFAYRPGPGDSLTLEPGWERVHLADVDLPLVGAARCHREVADVLARALAEVEDAGLAEAIGPEGLLGCWTPRTIRGTDVVSRHAWGVAVDLDVGDPETGLLSPEERQLATIFRRWGFTEGSSWLDPDPGHLEFVSRPVR